MPLLILSLLVCSALIFFVSHKASEYGAYVAKCKNWSEGFVGVLFLAFATSMPELFTSVAAVPSCLSIGKIDLGMANALGSLIINLMILAFLDIFINKGKTFTHANKDNIITGSFTLILLVLIALIMLVRRSFPNCFMFLGIGAESFVLPLIYIFGMRKLFHKRHAKEKKCSEKQPSFTMFFVLLFTVFLLGVWLGQIGNAIVEISTINESFVGSLLLAFVSSLPELSVSLAALRLGSINMSIGNILGSNFFDVCIVPAMDFCYRKGAMLANVGGVNFIIVGFAFALTSIVVFSLHQQKKVKRPKFLLPSILIVILGLSAYALIYKFG